MILSILTDPFSTLTCVHGGWPVCITSVEPLLFLCLGRFLPLEVGGMTWVWDRSICYAFLLSPSLFLLVLGFPQRWPQVLSGGPLWSSVPRGSSVPFLCFFRPGGGNSTLLLLASERCIVSCWCYQPCQTLVNSPFIKTSSIMQCAICFAGTLIDKCSVEKRVLAQKGQMEYSLTRGFCHNCLVSALDSCWALFICLPWRGFGRRASATACLPCSYCLCYPKSCFKDVSVSYLGAQSI